ncbi:hypothetical protein KAK07_19600 [Ideonella sp. 4Y16]|uniref:hypothetical protein n=1 Tax=Ideonella alba TaxID=2824118 RepID=UPI001B360365|nr:hypothetical protein [Ideonella alba]MBQ0945554.1 hypothetical protein [Ideonella alba]
MTPPFHRQRPRRVLALLLLACACSAARAEPEIPPPAEFVAGMELGIAACSRRTPAQAAVFARVRQVLAGSFAGRTYASYIGTAEYEAHHQRLSTELSQASEADLAESCQILLQLAQGPPQGILYHR